MNKLRALLALVTAVSTAVPAASPSSFTTRDGPEARVKQLNALAGRVTALEKSGGGGSGVTSVNTRTGAVTIISGDVISALGYTPAAPLGFTPLNSVNNLSDVANVGTARTNLGLGSAATQASSAFASASHTHAFTDVVSIPTGSLIYRKTAGTGAAETQTLATLKTDLGLTGTNSGDQTITLTGDVTGAGTASFATTLATVNSNVGTFGDATHTPQITVDGKGRITAASSVAITGGSNPWTEKTITASDFTSTSTTPVAITDGTTTLSFVPPANSQWEAEAVLLLYAVTATVLPEVSVAVSAQGAGAYGSVMIQQTGATASSRVTLDGTWTTAAVTLSVPAGGLPAASTPYMCFIRIRGHSGPVPSGISIQLASETAGQQVKALAGSQLRVKSS